MRKINEIFYSLQGEGHHSGYPAVFVRFAGCNLKCPFCDTKHSEGIPMSDEDIIHAVNLYKADWVILTGGEPTLQIDEEFVHLLQRATGKRVAIETNGTHPVPENIDWVTVSPKEGLASEAGAENRAVHDAREHPGARLADEIKVVDCGQDLERYFTSPWRSEKTLMYLQPCYVPDEERFHANRLATVRRILADPRWTLSLQTHRYLQIP